MDTTAYLHSQGWLGAGHALAARGLSKPLLVSQKQNVLGVGKKRHDAHADQWWARAFDGCLKGLEVSRVVEGRAKEKDGKKEEGNGEKGSWEEGGVRVEGRGGGLDTLRSGRAGLYGFFVRGEGLRGTFVEDAVGAGGGGKGGGGKRREGQGVEDRAERKQRRKERKERGIAEGVAVVAEEVVDEQLSKRLRKDERKKRRRGRDDANDGAVTATAIAVITQGVSSSSLPKKKRRRDEASDGGSSPELIMSEDRGTTENLVSGNCELKGTDEADPKAMQTKEKSSVEKLERRCRRAARKTLEAEQNHSADGQAGQEGDGTNKTHRKEKRKHSKKQTQALE